MCRLMTVRDYAFEIIAWNIDGKHFSLIILFQDRLDFIECSGRLNHVLHDDNRVELIPVREMENIGLGNFSFHRILIFQKHRKDTDILIVLICLCQKTIYKATLKLFVCLTC